MVKDHGGELIDSRDWHWERGCEIPTEPTHLNLPRTRFSKWRTNWLIHGSIIQTAFLSKFINRGDSRMKQNGSVSPENAPREESSKENWRKREKKRDAID